MSQGRGGVFAVIPARGGSKGIPGKNLVLVGGVPLVARAILAAREASLGGVAVSTDSEAIANVARTWDAEVINRPAAISGDTATSEAALLHALDVFEAQGRVPDVLVFLQCTSPFFSGADIRAVLAPVLDGGFDSAFSVTADHGFLWRIGVDGCAEGINHDHKLPRRRRQELPPQFRENGAIYAMRASVFRESGNRFCGRTALAVTDIPVVELDSPSDLLLADAIAARRATGLEP